MRAVYIGLICVLCGGCATSRYDRYVAERRAQMLAVNWPLVEPEFAKNDVLEGAWIQCDEDEFDSKAPWGSRAHLLVTHSEVTLTVGKWTDEMSALDMAWLKLLLSDRGDQDFAKIQDDIVTWTAPRRRVWLVGGERSGTHYLSPGMFDPPLYFKRE